ncbi:hypothetical protein [Lentilactobacillus sp. SPB1-3]|uniref:Uncharacterized protein n=1 Tax=Lentilactobacillus terminaliae TaxID=3003483 RepID=A0ACD5DDI5_9LACO|nr:hypothetical protein [Lentilactobacillus sp. SPB1-3]MCZ0978039.1 hypothetical protein [Lentilactobacillus sp. SPB1-3]
MTVEVTGPDYNFLPKAINEIRKLNQHSVYVGALKQVGDRTVEYMQMIVHVNEYGATIHPTTSQYLTIPMPIAGKRKAGQIDGLFFYMTKNGKPSLARNEGGQLVVYFLLAKEVRIPARSFLRTTEVKTRQRVRRLAVAGVTQLLHGHGTWKEVYNAIGQYVAREVKRTIATKSRPKNATITSVNKGFNNPLVDTGAMQRSIYWRVV